MIFPKTFQTNSKQTVIHTHATRTYIHPTLARVQPVQTQLIPMHRTHLSEEPALDVGLAGAFVVDRIGDGRLLLAFRHVAAAAASSFAAYTTFAFRDNDEQNHARCPTRLGFFLPRTAPLLLLTGSTRVKR